MALFKKPSIAKKIDDTVHEVQGTLEDRIGKLFAGKAPAVEGAVQAGVGMATEMVNPARQFGIASVLNKGNVRRFVKEVKKDIGVDTASFDKAMYKAQRKLDEAFEQSSKGNAPTSFTDEAISIANKTTRAWKKGTAVTKVVSDKVGRDETVLDFGAGKTATQSDLLRKSGFKNVTSHDFGTNVVEGLHDPQALSKAYDVVQVSNVLNVQSTPQMLSDTLQQVAKVTKKRAFLNYPTSPRKMNLSPKQMEQELQKHFSNVERVKVKGDPMWEVSN